MKLYAYKDYAEYKRLQTERNKTKLQANPDIVWVEKEEIGLLAGYIRASLPEARFGLCHGTRGGKEQAWLREALGIPVLGTEISDTASRFPDTIQWDFHEVKEEWLGRVDFIYSNALDHSYDPRLCLRQWLRCVRPGGLCALHWSPEHAPAGGPNYSGCAWGTTQDYRELIEAEFRIADVLRRRDREIFIVRHR